MNKKEPSLAISDPLAGEAAQRVLRDIAQLNAGDKAELFRRIAKASPPYLRIAEFRGDVSSSREFQRTFNYFYQVRRNEKWRTPFYRLFQELRSLRGGKRLEHRENPGRHPQLLEQMGGFVFYETAPFTRSEQADC